MRSLTMIHQEWVFLACLLTSSIAAADSTSGQELNDRAPRVNGNVVLYQNPRFYASFPSIIRRPNGDLLVAFRRAPDRRAFGEGITHTDANSYLMLVRSPNGGQTWSEPQLFSAYPFGGSQDPCLVQLGDGTLICSSYSWAPLGSAAIDKLRQPVSSLGNFVFLGGYLLRSRDGGVSWNRLEPPPCPGETRLDIFGTPVPAYNRGAMYEGKDGRLYWVVATVGSGESGHTANRLLVSEDEGGSWNPLGIVARDDKITFNEASIYQTPRGDLVAFVRTQDFNDHAVIARSTDGGETFEWKDAGFPGHPLQAMRLPDDRVLLVYGYRHPPFGVRARVLNAECTDAAEAPEIILRDDGGNGDLGYPWATLVSDHRALVVYYFNRDNGPRFIAGTFLDF